MTPFLNTARAYYLLTKPGIILGNLLTLFAGFMLACRGQLRLEILAAAMGGLSCVIASGCVLNNYIDQEADKKMQRTQKRSNWLALVSVRGLLIFAISLAVLGLSILAIGTNFLATAAAFVGFVVYLFFYSFLKYRSHYATLIGSIAGAVPPVVGYTAVTSRLDLLAFLLFLTVALWQMPHFYAIAIFRAKEYAKADIPVWPLVKGLASTKVQMLLFTFLYAIAAQLVFWFGETGNAYWISSLVLGAAWLGLALYGFFCKEECVWARKMFVFSLIVITGFAVTL